MSHPNQLPSYERPPVVEVVASLQFEPLAGFDVLAIGKLALGFSNQFPRFEQHAPLGAEIERLGVRAPLNTLQFQFTGELGVPRVWFLNEPGTELVQVQSDRFIRNWRFNPTANNQYPRYDAHVRPAFVKDFQRFGSLVKDFRLGELKVHQCEITYINHIYPNKYWSQHSDIGAVLNGWKSVAVTPFEEQLEAVNARFARVLLDASSTFVGRLHVQIQSAFVASKQNASEDVPVFVLTLTARGRPLGDGEAGVLAFLDMGRRSIVTSFDKMTSAQMHEVWGKVQ
jgi:uncharacterized protein (TIGR04255 family)